MKKYLLLALIALVASACSKEEEDKSLEPASADDIITPEKTLGLIGGTINEVKTAFQGFKPSSEYNTSVAYDLKMDDYKVGNGRAHIFYRTGDDGRIRYIEVMYYNAYEYLLPNYIERVQKVYPSTTESFFGFVNPGRYAYGLCRSIEDFNATITDQSKIYSLVSEFDFPEKSVKAKVSYLANSSLDPTFILQIE